MKKEKYIIERLSTSKEHSGKVVSYVVFIPFWQNGERKNYNVTFRVKDYVSPGAAKKAAIDERNRMIPVLKQMSRVAQQKTYTVDELFDLVPQYFPVRKGSIVKNTKVYNKHIKPFYGDKDIHDIKMVDVQKTLNSVAAYCVQQTVRNVKTDWHRIFQVATIMGQGTTDWTTVIQTPLSSKVTDRALSEQNISEDEFNAFIEYMSGYGGYMPSETERIYNRDILVLLLKVMRASGIRLQEARGLSRKDVAFAREEIYDKEEDKVYVVDRADITVRHSAGTTLTEDNVIRNTKTPWSIRRIPVYDEGVQWLKEAIEYSMHDIIFAKYSGEPFTSTEASDYIGRVSRKRKKVTGIDLDVYSTLMRKAYSSDQYREHVSPAVVKKLMGHRYETTSINWYASASDEEVREASRNRKYKKKD